jgi:hypothetical protein
VQQLAKRAEFTKSGKGKVVEESVKNNAQQVHEAI